MNIDELMKVIRGEMPYWEDSPLWNATLDKAVVAIAEAISKSICGEIKMHKYLKHTLPIGADSSKWKVWYQCKCGQTKQEVGG